MSLLLCAEMSMDASMNIGEKHLNQLKNIAMLTHVGRKMCRRPTRGLCP